MYPKKHYDWTSRVSTSVAIFALVGILWTSVAGRDKNGSKGGTPAMTWDGNTNLRPSQDEDDSFVENVPPGTYPPGPYITLQGASEMIDLPSPPQPDIIITTAAARTACPWDVEEQANLLDWHDTATWGNGQVPITQGQDVTLPANQRVVLRQSILEALGVITIPKSSTLILADAISNNNQPLELHATGIHVQGTLTAGSPTCPILHGVGITLHGARPTGESNLWRNPTPPTHKGIYVDGGTLEMHGQVEYPTWTRLARTVDPVADAEHSHVILLQHAVTWKVGQEVVVVTSALKDSRDAGWNRNEVRKIVAIESPTRHLHIGSMITLDAPLQYRHVANGNYQSEVGLLSRTIKVQGAADDSEPTDPDPGNCVVDPTQTQFMDATTAMPCPDTEITGYGGHILVTNNGLAQVQGVELYRMGKTNIESRFPMHFHLLGECPDCYFQRSSIHRSYYRCAVIQGTNSTRVMENVAYDAIGHCFALLDGAEERNNLSFNLAAHIHWLGPEPASIAGREQVYFDASPTLAFPADTSASGFFIPNGYNTLVGNAASGGCFGFHFINLDYPLGTFRDWDWSPSSRPSLEWNGNTAHSTGFWWYHAAAFYFGGTLIYKDTGLLEYTPMKYVTRDPCRLRKKRSDCKPDEFAWNQMNNSKAFLVTSYSLKSVEGRIEFHAFESHDSGSLSEVIGRGVWFNRILHVCRTGEPIPMPDTFHTEQWLGSSLLWQGIGQEYILSDSVFRNCGVRSDEFAQYDDSPTRGCPADGSSSGCHPESSVFYFDSLKDNMLPEIVKTTKNITFDNCGRRFSSASGDTETGQAILENWIDADGSVSGLGEHSYIVSGMPRSRSWWNIDDEVALEPHRPSYLVKKGTTRGLAHLQMVWDEDLHYKVGRDRYCYQMWEDCPDQGYVRHLGKRFTPDPDDYTTRGLPVTAAGKVVGLIGGYGWLLEFKEYGAPKKLTFERMEIEPDAILMLSIKYPPGTTFSVVARANLCRDRNGYTCSETFQETDNIEEVRKTGNKYHVDSASGVLTIRLFQMCPQFVRRDLDGDGVGDWLIPDWETPGKDFEYAIPRFQRDGVRVPEFDYFSSVTIEANCIGGGKYCAEDVSSNYDPDVCPAGYIQVGYDKCCRNGLATDCKYPGEN